MTIKWKRYPGRRLRSAGLYRFVPMAVYHSDALVDGHAIAGSGCRTIFRYSPKHYWDTCVYNAKGERIVETRPMVLGRAAHHSILGEADFDNEYIERPARLNHQPWVTNRLDCQAWLAQQAAAGKTVITKPELERVKGMARSLAGNHFVGGKQVRILDGLIECTLIWKDLATGIWCKARPDVVPVDSGMFADLKTCESVTAEAVQRTINARHFHIGAGMLSFGCEQVLGFKLESFCLVFVESDRPYAVAVKQLSQEDIALGRMVVRQSLDTLARCLDANRWPGPDEDSVIEVSISKWERERTERRLGIPLTQ
jgi:hypothetical protein